MRVAVTGGAGFIGSHLVAKLLDRENQVLVVDNLSAPLARTPSAAAFEQADVRDASAADAISDFKPDVVVHLAAQMSVKVSMRDPVLDASVNAVGLQNIISATVRSGCHRFLFASSGGTIYGAGQTGRATDERALFAPESFYGVSKAAASMYLTVWERSHGLSHAELALGNVYGPGQSPDGEAGVVAIFGARLLRGEKCIVNGDGRTVRDYIFVEDVADAFVAALTGGSGLINIATARGLSVLQVHQHLCGLLGIRADSHKEHGPQPPGEVPRIVLGNRRALTELSWSPHVTFEDGARRTMKWLEGRSG